MLPSAELKVPAWAEAAQQVLTEVDDSVDPRLEAQNRVNDDAVLSILRQEKKSTPQREAWWTCSACPQRHRWMEGAVFYHFMPRTRTPYPLTATRGNEWEATDEWKPLKVVRCRPCMRKRDRHHRMVRSLQDILEEQMIRMGTSARFVTLTVENSTVPMEDGIIPDERVLGELVRDLKRKMYRFSRTVAYQDKVLGAVEVYEQTFTPSGDGESLSVNTHIHAVWLGTYWDQKDLQDRWGGIVHISKPESRKAVIRYISKYITKDPVPGTRAKETRGVMRAR